MHAKLAKQKKHYAKSPINKHCNHAGYNVAVNNANLCPEYDPRFENFLIAPGALMESFV